MVVLNLQAIERTNERIRSERTDDKVTVWSVQAVHE